MTTREPTSLQVILLDGASGAGKSSILECLRDEFSASVQVGAKFTTRKRRSDDRDWEFQFVTSIAECYARYSFSSVGNSYAVNIEELSIAIERGMIYATSCVDRRTTEVLRSEYTTVAIYVYRPLNVGDLDALLESRGRASPSESELRRDELTSVAEQYLAKLDIYDHVILNVGSKRDMTEQLTKILRRYGVTADAARADST